MTPEVVLTVFGVGLGIVGLLTAAAVVVRSNILRTTNEILDTALKVERQERTETERRCREEVAELKGKVNALTSDLAQALARELVRAFHTEVAATEAAKNGKPGV